MPETNNLEPYPPLSSRDRILFAAKRLFALNGYENTSTVAIAREAATSESQLMKHFGSKQGLLVAIFDRGWASIDERIQMVQHHGSAADRLFAVLEAVVIELENDSDLKELMMLESRRVRRDNRDVLISQGFQQFTNVLDRILRQMRDQGKLRPGVNLEAVRAALVGMTEGLLRDQVVAKRAGTSASYGFEDVKKVLELIVPAFSVEGVQVGG